MTTTVTFDSGLVTVPDDSMHDWHFVVITVSKQVGPGVLKQLSREWRMQLPEGFTRWQVLHAARAAVAADEPDMADALILFFDVQPNGLTR